MDQGSGPRVEDDDDSRWVFEAFGPLNRNPSPERRCLQVFMQRVARDVQDHPAEYGALRDALILLAENLARTCTSNEELERRLNAYASGEDERAAAAVLLRKVWQAQQTADAER